MKNLLKSSKTHYLGTFVVYRQLLNSANSLCFSLFSCTTEFLLSFDTLSTCWFTGNEDMCVLWPQWKQSQAVSASSSCRLTYLKLKAFANEISLPCELKLFCCAPAKPGCQQWLWCVLCAPRLGGEAKWPEWCSLAVVVKAMQWHGSSGYGSSVIYSWTSLLQYKRWKTLHKSQVHPGLPS